mmetsp:Transcript_38762/g.106782  ORF Transcript_38762/g.106782 Transcript_38762/m.106782 type:complete len:289 (-) Transcript_38762:417-1283(-)
MREGPAAGVWRDAPHAFRPRVGLFLSRGRQGGRMRPRSGARCGGDSAPWCLRHACHKVPRPPRAGGGSAATHSWPRGGQRRRAEVEPWRLALRWRRAAPRGFQGPRCSCSAGNDFGRGRRAPSARRGGGRRWNRADRRGAPALAGHMGQRQRLRRRQRCSHASGAVQRRALRRSRRSSWRHTLPCGSEACAANALGLRVSRRASSRRARTSRAPGVPQWDRGGGHDRRSAPRVAGRRPRLVPILATAPRAALQRPATAARERLLQRQGGGRGRTGTAPHPYRRRAWLR